jgi:hypothetical protein
MVLQKAEAGSRMGNLLDPSEYDPMEGRGRVQNGKRLDPSEYGSKGERGRVQNGKLFGSK